MIPIQSYLTAYYRTSTEEIGILISEHNLSRAIIVITGQINNFIFLLICVYIYVYLFYITNIISLDYNQNITMLLKRQFVV